MSSTDILALVTQLLDKWDDLPNDVASEPELEQVAQVISKIENLVDDDQDVLEDKTPEKVRALELAILNIKDVLLKEIKWCRDNQNSEETQKAFIAGLEQAQRLVNAAQKTLLMDDRYGDGILRKV